MSELKCEAQEGFNMKKERKSNAEGGNLWANANSKRESGKGLIKMYNIHRHMYNLKVFFIIGLISLDF